MPVGFYGHLSDYQENYFGLIRIITLFAFGLAVCSTNNHSNWLYTTPRFYIKQPCKDQRRHLHRHLALAQTPNQDTGPRLTQDHTCRTDPHAPRRHRHRPHDPELHHSPARHQDQGAALHDRRHLVTTAHYLDTAPLDNRLHSMAPRSKNKTTTAASSSKIRQGCSWALA